MRHIMQVAPFYVSLSTRHSREHASRWAKTSYYPAGETSTAVCSIAYAAIARAASIPGAHTLLLAVIVFNAISTIVTTRGATGDYGSALRALRN